MLSEPANKIKIKRKEREKRRKTKVENRNLYIYYIERSEPSGKGEHDPCIAFSRIYIYKSLCSPRRAAFWLWRNMSRRLSA